MNVRCNCIPVESLREEFARSGLSIREVARRAGYHNSHVSRILGTAGGWKYLVRDGVRQRVPVRRHGVSFETAARLCRAMHVDPIEVGL